MKKSIKIIAVTLIALSLLVGCQPRKLDVAYTVYPVQYLLERIGGEKVVTHALSSSTNVMRSTLVEDYKTILKEADTIFTIGGLEPYLDTINQDIADFKPNIFDLGSKGAIVPFVRYTTAIVDNVDVVVESNYYENPLFDNIDTYVNDPYIWLDPIMMTSMANEVLAYFVSNDPDNTSYYERNFEEVKMELAYLDANYSELKGSQLSLASMVPAFGSYANNYGFSISPIILSKYGNLPTTAQLEVIKSRLIQDNVKHLLVEEGLDADIMELAYRLSEELELELVYVNSLSSRSQQQVNGNLDYIAIMNENLQTLKTLQQAE